MQALRDAGSGNPEPRQEPTGLPLATLQWTGRSMCAVPGGFSTHPDIHGLLSARRRAARTCTATCCIQHAAAWGCHSSLKAGSALPGEASARCSMATSGLSGTLGMSNFALHDEHACHVCCSIIAP